MGYKEKEKRGLSRRGFLKMSSTGALAALAACTNYNETTQIPPTSTITQTPITPTPTKTETPTATATPTESLPRVEDIPYNPEQRVIVLEHHNPNYGNLENGHQPVYMTTETFEDQLITLKDSGFYTPNQEEILGWLEKKHGLPARSVIIRIDIGVPFKDYEEGFRLLEKHGMKAILFILTVHMTDEESQERVGWDTIKRYVDKDVLIAGSHGTNHIDYAEASRSDALWDALNSKEIIEEKLEREIYFFAYPFDSEGHDEALLEHFRMLFGVFGTLYAHAGNPRVGTYYPYLRGESFDWENFDSYLESIEE
jgi:peptidoglycan/xylan/chitin deacetylase (PgdA/CDA1 family)